MLSSSACSKVQSKTNLLSALQGALWHVRSGREEQVCAHVPRPEDLWCYFLPGERLVSMRSELALPELRFGFQLLRSLLVYLNKRGLKYRQIKEFLDTSTIIDSLEAN